MSAVSIVVPSSAIRNAAACKQIAGSKRSQGSMPAINFFPFETRTCAIPHEGLSPIEAGSLPALNHSTRSFWPARSYRSEEHTAELQSHLNLVCRLLLEKKN